jgi:hypothetical protein
VFVASIPSKPGNPQLPWGSVTGAPAVLLTHFPPAMAGSTYFVP